MNMGDGQGMMLVEKTPENGLEPSPPHAPRILSGLWRQREELGLIADELIELFRRHGVADRGDASDPTRRRRDPRGGTGHT